MNRHADDHPEQHGDDHVHPRPDCGSHTQRGQRTDEHPGSVVSNDKVHTSLPEEAACVKEKDEDFSVPCPSHSADFPLAYGSGSCKHACLSALLQQ